MVSFADHEFALETTTVGGSPPPSRPGYTQKSIESAALDPTQCHRRRVVSSLFLLSPEETGGQGNHPVLLLSSFHRERKNVLGGAKNLTFIRLGMGGPPDFLPPLPPRVTKFPIFVIPLYHHRTQHAFIVLD